MRKATRLLTSDPAFLLTPVFSFWTYGPTTSGGCYACGMTDPKISFSYRLTWVNSFLTIFGTFVVVVSYDFSIRTDVTTLFTADSLLGHHTFMLFFLTYPFPLFAFALVCLILVQHFEKCSGCCGASCTENLRLTGTDKTETHVKRKRSSKGVKRGTSVEEKVTNEEGGEYRRRSLIIV